MAGVLAVLTQMAERRARAFGRRAALRGALMGGCVLAALLCICFALAAATAALADQVGIIAALAIMAGAAMLVVLVFLLALSVEERRHRTRVQPMRARLDRDLYRAAAVSMAPRRPPSRGAVGLGLVALGALLVLARRGD
jgi:Na+/melibiose symporter-like transporter